MPFTSPFEKTICPTCFHAIRLGECDIVAVDEGERVLRSRPAGIARGIGWIWTPSIRGEKYNRTLATWRCSDCGNLLPPNADEAEMLPIAIVGGSSSGKSQYLAALIKTLKEGGLSGLGCSSFRAASQDVDVRYKADYYAPLFVSREPLIHTQRIRTSEVYVPLVYEAEFAGGTSSRSAEPRKVNLVFFDVSGEDLQDQDTLRRGVAHIVNAAAILLLIDPLTLPNVVEVLPKYFRADDAITAASDDAYQMMSKLTAVFALNRDGRRSHRIPVPLALTIAKSDLLEFVIGGLPPDSPLLQDTRYPRGCQQEAMESTRQETEAFLRRFGAGNLIEAARSKFETVTTCATSATGEAAFEGHYVDPRPIRCLDPLVWCLAQLGIVECAESTAASSAHPTHTLGGEK